MKHLRYSIVYKKELDTEILFLLNKLPTSLKISIEEFCKKNNYLTINELRIKRNSFLYLISNGYNLKTDIFVNNDDFENLFEYICQGSLYAHVNTIKEGYIPLGCGIRAGICGTAILENDVINGIKDISSINIRIPQKIPNASEYVFSLLQKSNFTKSILIYSAPGVGKTSILRDLVSKLSNLNNGIRFAVIDSREEIITKELLFFNIFNF